MRELTHSVASFSWAMSLFGVEQMAKLVSPRRAAAAFRVVARAAEETLGPGLRSTFRTGERIQHAFVEVPFRLAGRGSATAGDDGSPGSAAEPGVLSLAGDLAFQFLQLGVSAVYWTSGTAWRQQKGQPGWGPVPDTDPRQ